MIILQISPEFSPGTGVGGVAHALEQEWRARGHEVRRFSIEEAGALRFAATGWDGRVLHAFRVVWFSTVGTIRARRAVGALPPEAISVCHNDALAGDVYINHGVLQTAMRARGHYWWRMVRNPLHLFTAVRDQVRYQGAAHRYVVNLTLQDDKALRRVYPKLRIPTCVIGNGVDVERFRPPTAIERRESRSRLHLPEEAVVTIFIGNEYERKGLFPLLEAIYQAGERHHLIVVGGSADMIENLSNVAEHRGIKDRCRIVGKQDPLPYLWAADVLAQPSVYESYGLVVTEALATGLPVLSTAVGVAPDVIEDGVNGFITDGKPEDMASALRWLELADREALANASRRSALQHTWSNVADSYLRLFAKLSRAEVN